ncbi:MAG: hypothetical protein WCS37_22385 [Chloroflexota bacterium]|nr:hypothetical protein [Chloroflexota bacterium]
MSLEAELETEIKHQLQEGIKLARAGEKVAAEEVFSRILSAKPAYEDALVWKAAVTEDNAAAVDCLKQALKVNPNNRRAQAGLEWAQHRLDEQAKQPIATIVVTSTPLPSAGTDPLPKLQPEAKSSLPPLVLPPVAPPDVSKAKNETKPSTPPYKKSRFNNQAPVPALPPEAYLPVNSKRTKKVKKPKGTFSVRPFSRNSVGGVLQTAAPKIALTVSDKVVLGKQTGYRQTNTVKVVWPLLLFVMALALALLTFLFSFLAPLFGALALLFAIGGIVLFNRAEF